MCIRDSAYPEQGNGMAVVLEGYAAHFIRSNYPSTPLWLSEGLSELYGTFRIEDGVADIGRPSAENLKLLRSAPLLPLRGILGMTPESPGYAVEKRSIFEAQSWALVHHLLYGTPDGHPRTADFLRRLDAGEFLDVFTATPQQLAIWCREGVVTDAKTVAGLLWVQQVLSGAWTLDWHATDAGATP